MSELHTLKFSELHCREVINLCDGARMGEVTDLEIDPISGFVTAIMVPGKPGFFGSFQTKDSCVIPWKCIETLGEDYILVRFQK